MSAGWIGRPVPRREDPRLVQGRSRYVDDLRPEGVAHLAFARSPLAHAELRGVDATAALGAGALGTWVAADLPPQARALPLGGVPTPPGMEVASWPMPVLARERVRFVGEPIAAVLASDRAQAADAAALVAADLEPLPVAVELDRDASSGIVHSGPEGDRLFRWRLGEGDVEGQLRTAATVVRARLQVPRLVAAPIETRACLAAYDSAQDLLTLWCSAQDAARPLNQLCAVLGRSPQRTRVVVGDVGGAFGSKGGLTPEYLVACVAAMATGRPVKWVESRSENFQAAYQGRGLQAEAELGVAADGTFTSLRVDLTFDAGAYLLPHTTAPAVNCALLLCGAYAIPVAEVRITGLATNKVPTGPYRGAGRPEATYIVERLVDEAAATLGRDPLDLRRQNLVQTFPHRTPVGSEYDSGDLGRLLDSAAELAGYAQLRERRADSRRRGRLFGLGAALFVESSGNAAWESASARLTAAGRLVLSTGSKAHGQGHETTFAQIAADAFGVDPAAVDVSQGDSFQVPPGVGSFASRSVTVGGSAAFAVVEELKAQARRVAAGLLQVPEADVAWTDGQFRAGDSAVSLEAVGEAGAGPDAEAPLRAEGKFTLPGLVFSSGAYIAAVEADPETGHLDVVQLVAVDDAGRIVNPLLAEGQVEGSSAQGLGAALSEEAIYDADGQLVSGTFIDYGILGPPEVSMPFRTRLQETPSPLDPLGAKGIGECGTIGVPAAVANAVADALRGRGDTVLDPPFTAEKLWRAANRSSQPAPVQP